MTDDTQKMENILRQSGLRVTEQRLAVFQELLGRNTPQSAASVSKALPRVDTVTVYRTLDSFVSAGVARRIDVGHNHAHFEVAHLHRDTIQCRKCGKREEIDECVVSGRKTKRVERLLKDFSTIEDHVVQFSSICNTCRQ